MMARGGGGVRGHPRFLQQLVARDVGLAFLSLLEGASDEMLA
jgi:hypothetical protein